VPACVAQSGGAEAGRGALAREGTAAAAAAGSGVARAAAGGGGAPAGHAARPSLIGLEGLRPAPAPPPPHPGGPPWRRLVHLAAPGAAEGPAAKKRPPKAPSAGAGARALTETSRLLRPPSA